MKNIVEIFKNRGVVFKELKKLDLKKFGIKKRYEIFEGVDIKNRYYLIFVVDRKSRFVSKNVDDLLQIYQKISSIKDYNYKFLYTLFLTNFCSKAKDLLIKKGFKIVDASLWYRK